MAHLRVIWDSQHGVIALHLCHISKSLPMIWKLLLEVSLLLLLWISRFTCETFVLSIFAQRDWNHHIVEATIQ